MRLQTKFAVSILPVVLISIVVLGVWAIHVTTDDIERSTFRYMKLVLDTYITDKVNELHSILVDNRLETETAFVKDYQQRAVTSAREIHSSESGRFVIMHAFGGLILPKGDHTFLQTASVWKRLMDPLFQETETHVKGHVHIEQEGFLYVARYFAPWQWGIMYAVSDTEVHAAQRSIRNITLLIVCGCALLSSAIIFVIFQTFLVRPVTTLREAASSIARGEVVERIPVYSQDELGELTRNMEVMANAIAAYREEQTASQEYLEAQVQERTRALQDSEKRYKNIFHAVPASLIIADSKGNIVEVNSMACRQYQYSREEFIGMHASQCITPQTQEKLQEFIEAIKTDSRFFGETVDIRKDGTTFDTEVYGSIISFQGTPHMLAIIRDVTARKQAEQQLQAYAAELHAMNQELSQYAYIVSHNLQTPLRGIRNYADFLSEDLEPRLDSEHRHYLEGLKYAVQEVNILIRDWLELAQIGRQSREYRTISLHALLQSIVTTLELSADVQVVVQDNWPAIQTEPVLVHHVFQHLISNAVKFNRSSPKRIELGWRQGADPNTIECFVRDNGIGISGEYQERIFHVFDRLHTKEEFEGTGIGLAIVKKALVKLGGAIRLESSPGEGSTFFVILPKV